MATILLVFQQVHEGAKLYDAQLIGKQDPYVILRFKGGPVALREPEFHRTRTHDDGDKEPKWDESFVL